VGLGSADGMSFILLPTDQYGDTGESGIADFIEEEPNLAGALGIGFDTWDNDEEGELDPDNGCGFGGPCVDRRGNHISVHYDGAIAGDIVRLDPDTELQLINGEWHHVTVLVNEDPQGARVSVILTDGLDGSVSIPFVDFVVPGMDMSVPYRAMFAARTGGEADFHDIDNLVINFGGGDPCDFDGDGSLGLGDLNLLLQAVKSGANDPNFDVNGDSSVNSNDITSFVTEPAKLNTYIGDANLDGVFSSTDFVLVFQAGEYEDTAVMNSVWQTGDWNGDGDFNSSDFVFAFQGGGYELGPRQAVSAVPEPSSAVLLLLGGLMLVRRRRGN
jgi:hypothetical protein